MTHGQDRKPTRKYEERIVTGDEAKQVYVGEWVLMEVFEEGPSVYDVKGIVRYASKNRRRITDESVKLRDARISEGKPCQVFVFYALPEPASEEESIEEGLRVMELMAGLARSRRTRAEQSR